MWSWLLLRGQAQAHHRSSLGAPPLHGTLATAATAAMSQPLEEMLEVLHSQYELARARTGLYKLD